MNEWLSLDQEDLELFKIYYSCLVGISAMKFLRICFTNYRVLISRDKESSNVKAAQSANIDKKQQK